MNSREVFDETGYFCTGCGRFNPMRYNFCPDCGTERFAKSQPSVGQIPTDRQKIVYNPQNEISEYLNKRGLLHLADRQFNVSVELENGEIVTIQLLGKQNSNDVLNCLRNMGLLRTNMLYRLPDWPDADPCLGPWYHHVGSCVCELNQSHVYHVQSLGEGSRAITLYGCPNSKSVVQGTILSRMKVEVMDYEKECIE